MVDIADIKAKCSSIFTNREAALKEKGSYAFLVYLDTHDVYPQIKIIAPNPKDYEAMSNAFDQRSHVGDRVFSIHDDYSHYLEHNNETYTFPLVDENYAFLREFLSDKDKSNLLDTFMGELPERLNEKFKQVETSTSLTLFNKIKQYADWESDEHLFSGNEKTGLTHLEVLRGLQKACLSDDTAVVFITDEGKLIVNKFLERQLIDKIELEDGASDVVVNYEERYKQESKYTQARDMEDSAKMQLAQMDELWVCGVLLEGHTSIFLPYQTRVIQCQNDTYAIQIDSEHVKTKCPSGMRLPGQLDLIELMGARGRWSNNPGENELIGSFDFKHKAWQCGVKYKPIKPEQKVLLQAIMREGLADETKASHLLVMPFDNYQLLVLCYNLKLHEKDKDVAESIANQCAAYVDLGLNKGTLTAIPDVLIDALEPYCPENSARYRAINSDYYKTVVHPLILQNLYEDLQVSIPQTMMDNETSDSSSVRIYLTANIYNKEKEIFDEVILSPKALEELSQAITHISNPSDLFALIIQYKTDVQPDYSIGNPAI